MVAAAARVEAPHVTVVGLTAALAEASQRALVVQTPTEAAAVLVVWHTGLGALQSAALVHVAAVVVAEVLLLLVLPLLHLKLNKLQ